MKCENPPTIKTLKTYYNDWLKIKLFEIQPEALKEIHRLDFFRFPSALVAVEVVNNFIYLLFEEFSVISRSKLWLL